MSIDYYIEKTSGTSADTLLAIGFASVLGDHCLKQHGNQEGIFLYDSGPYYRISLPSPIAVEHLPDDELLGLQIVLPLASNRQREKLAKKGDMCTLDGFPYDEKLEESRSYYEKRKKSGAQYQTPEAYRKHARDLRELIGPEPDARLAHYTAINQMKIAATFNDLALRWDRLSPDLKRLHIDLLLQLFSQPENDLPGAVASWQKLAKEYGIKGNAMVSALQIVNPTTGKGANRARAGELTIGNQESFWLLELLKFRGFMEGAAPLTVQESDDRKTYVIQPRQIKLTLLQDIMKQFRAVFWPTTAVKLDILAALRFAQALVDQYQTLFEQDGRLPPWLPREIVSLAQGFDVTFYKFLGSAYATMNISTIGLPTWLPRMESLEQVKAAQVMLDEHINLIRLLRNRRGEEGAEEYELLRLYRDFLSGDDLNAFWEFTTAYSGYVMSAREQNRYVQLFTTQGLEDLIMNNQQHGSMLKPIITNEGFKHIANAIRQSTITAQYRRTQLGDRTYETRYGLGQDLKRKAHSRAEFMEALSLFLQRYSEETAREEEKLALRLGRQLTAEDRRNYKMRANISERDLHDIIALIDEYGPGLICSLLIAFGYARRAADEES
jgi:hypothetical protein